MVLFEWQPAEGRTVFDMLRVEKMFTHLGGVSWLPSIPGFVRGGIT